MADEKQVTVQGVSPLFLLFLVFLVLKLTGYIGWSWLWVTAPLWGGFALIFLIVIVIAIGASLSS